MIVIIAISLIGKRRNAGKTTIASNLVKKLTESGVRVLVVKHASEGISLERGKDSTRYYESGAQMVITASAEDRLVIERSGAKQVEDLQDILAKWNGIIIIEGFKESTIPKVLVARELSDLDAKFEGKLIAIVAPKELHNEALRRFRVKIFGADDAEEFTEFLKTFFVKRLLAELPGKDCGVCGCTTCAEFADAVLRGAKQISNCVAWSGGVDVWIDNNRISLGSYPQRILRDVTKAMVNTLKGRPEKYKTIEIRIRNED